MPPRRYNLGRRGEAAEETRRLIVKATYDLHAEQGIAATSMKQIAERAGVSIGTVYHHFPTYEDAIRACGAHIQATVPEPTDAIFEGLETADERVERLAVAVYGWFERVPAFEHVRCDQERIPMLRGFVEGEEQNRKALMKKALEPLGVDEKCSRVAATLLDNAVFRGLRRADLSLEDAAHQIAKVILAWVASEPGPGRPQV